MVRQVVKNKYGSKYPRLHHAYNSPCRCRSAGIPEIMDALGASLSRTASDLELGFVGTGPDPSEMRALERAMAEEDRRLDKLMELFYADAIDVREFKRRRDASADMTSRMRERYDELRARMWTPRHWPWAPGRPSRSYPTPMCRRRSRTPPCGR